jgi:hypothetical protein
MRGNGCYKEDCEHFDQIRWICLSGDDMMDSSNLIFPVPICKFNPKAVDNKEWESLAAEAEKPPVPVSRPSTYDWVKSLRETFESNMYAELTGKTNASDKISWRKRRDGVRVPPSPTAHSGRLIPRLCSTCHNKKTAATIPPCNTCVQTKNKPNWQPSKYYTKGEKIEKRTEN